MRSLPIDAYLSEIVRLTRAHRALVVTAAPGAGKTTRIPPALAADGPVLVLQPRRVAARSMAARIALEQGWTLGQEVGWHVRFERRFSRDTRVLLATEGVLTARLQQDPLLTDVRTIILDEFHERSVHADVGIALARQAWIAREDLRLVVMSATLDAERVSAFLNQCPIVHVPGRLFPLDIAYGPGQSIEQAVADVLPRTDGALLCFLPGAPEIRRAADALGSTLQRTGVSVWPLHGGLDADAQDAAIRPSSSRRVILATNLAETTITVPDVTAVIDTGTHKIARYDADRGIDHLVLERISQDAADQRAGRAGRVRAGIVRRLWDARDRLRPHREPEILRIDLAGVLLDVIGWGGDPLTFEWFEAPAREAIDAAMTLLRRLGALDREGSLTPIGRQVRRLPIHPRLARFIIAAAGSHESARAAALLSERYTVPPRGHATNCDLLAAIEIDGPARLPPHVIRVARDLHASARAMMGGDARDLIRDSSPDSSPDSSSDSSNDERFRRAVLTAYPDRVARRRAPRSDRVVLSSGVGARIARESGVHDAEFIVAIEVTGGTAGTGGEPLVRLASGIAREWIAPTSVAVRHEFDDKSGRVRAVRVEMYDALAMAEQITTVDPLVAAPLLAAAYMKRGLSDNDQQLTRRLAFAGLATSLEPYLVAAAATVDRLEDIRLSAHLPADVSRQLEKLAPAMLRVPSGRSTPLDYRVDGAVFAAVKLQELFGLADTPLVGKQRMPVTFELLAPNGRPVQVTRDLKSFWERGYLEVRKELRAKYPRHPWPDDPWTATPTHRTTRKGTTRKG